MKRLIYNSLSGVLQKILTMVLIFCAIPVFINNLGLDNYGLFSILTILGSLNTFVNFGLQTALLVSLCKQGRTTESNNDIIVSLIFSLICSSLFSITIWLFREPLILKVFSIPQESFQNSVDLMLWLLLANVLLLTGQVLIAILQSQHHIVLTNTIQFFYNCIYWGGLIFVVIYCSTFFNIGAVIFLAALFWFLLLLYFSCKRWSYFEVSIRYKDLRNSLIKQVSYGSKVYASGIIGFFFEPFSKVLLSTFTGLDSVALFEIASKVKGNLVDLIYRAVTPLNPIIAEATDENKLSKTLFKLSNWIMLFATQISVLIIFVLPFLMTLWLGNDMNEEVGLFSVVLIINTLLFSVSNIPIYCYLLNRNHSHKNILVQLSSIIANAVFFYLFYQVIGAKAILLSNFMGYLFSFLLCKYYQIIYWASSYKKELIILMKNLIMGGGTYIALLLMAQFLKDSFITLVLDIIVVLVITLFSIRQLSMINKEDIQNIAKSHPRVSVAMSKIFFR